MKRILSLLALGVSAFATFDSGPSFAGESADPEPQMIFHDDSVEPDVYSLFGVDPYGRNPLGANPGGRVNIGAEPDAARLR
ncbi:MAG: hypothetical protein LBR53_09815 [Deltaproteobacteria bacterium]|jgi:hypothetical protein|nr:hypothetical protein [Deltaproteobacteria bacterium]